MKCRSCNSDRIADVSGKTSDMCFFRYKSREHDGYVPYNVGLGGGDYMRFNFCLQCGTIQGDVFPVPPSTLQEVFDRD